MEAGSQQRQRAPLPVPAMLQAELADKVYDSLFENNTKAIIWGQQQKAIQVRRFTFYYVGVTK